MRARRAEKVVCGLPTTDEALTQVGEVAITDDARDSADYKRDLAEVLVQRVAKQALQQAMG